MTGKKTITHKNASPAKRKAAVEASLLRKIKTEDEIKSLKEDLIKTEEKRRTILSEEKGLEERKVQQLKLKEIGENYRKEINRLTGVNKFTAQRNKDKITATLKDVTDSSTILHKLNERILNREANSKKELALLTASFKELLFKNEILKDMIALHQPVKVYSQKQREKCEKRKKEVMEEIEKTQKNIKRMMELDSERKNSEDLKTDTLEEYLDKQLLGFKKEISSLNQEIKTENNELKDITTLVEERRKELENIKQAIKNTPNKNVEKSREYKKIVEKNKQLQTQIDECLNRQDELTSKTRHIMNQIEDEKRRKTEDSTAEIDIKENLKKLKHELELRTICQEKDQSVLDELTKQNKIREEYMKMAELKSTKMSKECREEYEKIQAVKNQLSIVENKNKEMVRFISRISNQTLQKMTKRNHH